MDDFERELTRMMREGRAHTPSTRAAARACTTASVPGAGRGCWCGRAVPPSPWPG
ncbi:hypothetical protein ACFQZ0_05330 [Streptomyces erythrogriseus]